MGRRVVVDRFGSLSARSSDRWAQCRPAMFEGAPMRGNPAIRAVPKAPDTGSNSLTYKNDDPENNDRAPVGRMCGSPGPGQGKMQIARDFFVLVVGAPESKGSEC